METCDRPNIYDLDDLENKCERSTGRTICMITGGKHLSDFEKVETYHRQKATILFVLQPEINGGTTLN